MVHLNKVDLLKREVYYGAKTIRGGKGTAVTISMSKLGAEGSGLYTYGTFNPTAGGLSNYGEGITNYGGGIVPYGGMIGFPMMRNMPPLVRPIRMRGPLPRPFPIRMPRGRPMLVMGSGVMIKGGSIGSLFRKGIKMLKPFAKKAGVIARDVILPKVVEAASSQISNIKDPALKKLAQKGLSTGSRVVDNAIRGNSDVNSYLDIMKEEGRDLISDKNVQKKATQLVKNKSKGLSKYLGKGLDDFDVGGMRGAPLKSARSNVTKSNAQLTLLKDLIRSKPLTKTVM